MLNPGWIFVPELAYIIHYSNRVEVGPHDAPGMPTLVITPLHLVWQWTRENHEIMSKFDVFVHFCDEREAPPLTVGVLGKLTRDDNISDKSHQTASIIALASYEILRSRHGPGRQNETMKSSVLSELSPDWSGNLSNCFGTVIMDEAHIVRNPQLQTSIAMTWLSTSFHLLLTTTPLYNSKHDFRGLSQFMFSPCPTTGNLSSIKSALGPSSKLNSSTSPLLLWCLFIKLTWCQEWLWQETQNTARAQRSGIRNFSLSIWEKERHGYLITAIRMAWRDLGPWGIMQPRLSFVWKAIASTGPLSLPLTKVSISHEEISQQRNDSGHLASFELTRNISDSFPKSKPWAWIEWIVTTETEKSTHWIQRYLGCKVQTSKQNDYMLVDVSIKHLYDRWKTELMSRAVQSPVWICFLIGHRLYAICVCATGCPVRYGVVRSNSAHTKG